MRRRPGLPRSGGRRPAAFKEESREKAIGALTELDWGSTARAVRINGLDTKWCHDDVIEIVTRSGAHLDTIVVPKARTAKDVWWVDVLLTELEAKLDLDKRIQITLQRLKLAGRVTAHRMRRRADIRGRRFLAVAGRAGRYELRAAR